MKTKVYIILGILLGIFFLALFSMLGDQREVEIPPTPQPGNTATAKLPTDLPATVEAAATLPPMPEKLYSSVHDFDGIPLSVCIGFVDTDWGMHVTIERNGTTEEVAGNALCVSTSDLSISFYEAGIDPDVYSILQVHITLTENTAEVSWDKVYTLDSTAWHNDIKVMDQEWLNMTGFSWNTMEMFITPLTEDS